MFTNLNDFRAFVLAGSAVFTVVSKKSGERRTFRVRLSDGPHSRPNTYFLDVLRGPDNESDYQYMGFLYFLPQEFAPHQLGVPHVKTARGIDPDHTGLALMRWVIDQTFARTEDTTRLFERSEIHHSGVCGRCGRLLTTPQSIASGLGPICAQKGA